MVSEDSLGLTGITLGDPDETYVVDSLIGPDGQRLITATRLLSLRSAVPALHAVIDREVLSLLERAQ